MSWKSKPSTAFHLAGSKSAETIVEILSRPCRESDIGYHVSGSGANFGPGAHRSGRMARATMMAGAEVVTSLPSEASAWMTSLLREGRKIEAIKVYREATGCGLAEAKAGVERLETSPDIVERPAA